ncbi:MAG: CotH kinase family protein [Clostridia bacterium]|nr:CotH kinase family protein [Clostridia bacterium]
MIASKHITKIALALVAIALILCILAMGFSGILSKTVVAPVYSMEYETELFDTDQILTVDIVMEEESWNEMLQNAMRETYYQCDVVINGTTFYSVGIRPKGNTSLSSIANDPDNNRYSFKLEFDQFTEGQTCFGLDKLALNNNYADMTNMKEAIIYDMYRYIGVDAPLCNYAKVSVNGQYWGVYLAVEAIEDSFLLRNYGTENGKLYKPDNMNHTNREKNAEDSQTAEGKRPGGMGRGGGSDLNYTNDSLTSYSSIWNGAVTDSNDADHRRVVTALKNISEAKNPEKYLDVDNLLKYMAVHIFSVNDDSLSGNMAHNYYLYEAGGRLNILPWDYNLAFGGMGRGGSGESVVNDPIDSPFSMTNFFNPLLKTEEYLKTYHSYHNQLVEDYVFGGKFEETYNRIRTQIDELVKTDPNAMYSYEDYTKAAEMLHETVLLRAESIRGQLAGTIPSTEEAQRANPDSLIDASSIDTSVMAEFMGGGMPGNRHPFGENRTTSQGKETKK